MKKLKTKPYGEIEVDESQELIFPDGLFGFEKYQKFYLLENPESPFLWLQSSDEPGLAFIMIQPKQFKTDYELKISGDDLKSIELETIDENMLDFAIVTIPSDPSQMTANLQGPIIINVKKKIGRQAISLHDDYTVKCPILEEMKKTYGSNENAEEKKGA